MSLSNTPSSDRIHIGFFGRRNAGKSTLVNAVTNQEISVVSDVKGTTTDPVTKSMELLPLGPVVIIDTPGFDDEGALGELRVKRTKQILNKTDIAVLVADASKPLGEYENELVEIFKEKNIKYLIAYNKCDLLESTAQSTEKEVFVSASKKTNIDFLKECIGKLAPKENPLKMVGDFISEGDTVIFVTPIDEAAPKGRLILPQQLAVRDTLDKHAISVVVQEEQLDSAIKSLKEKPKLVVTDSQAFKAVAKIVPEDIPLTSFSILIARLKGLLDAAVVGAKTIDALNNGDKILISEGCTHHRQCNDIGTVKLPRWLEEYTGKKFDYEFSSGGTFADDLSGFSLIIHCGGCMLNEREMKYRVKCALDAGVPITNYGTAIAHMNGILLRSLGIMPNLKKIIDK